MSSINVSYNGEPREIELGSHEDYICARDIAHDVPRFSGTPEHASFEDFELAVRDHLFGIPKADKKKEPYIRAIIQRVLRPARLLLANKDITSVEDILEILAKRYRKTRDIFYYHDHICDSKMFDDESLKDFLRRLAVLVEMGLKAAVDTLGAAGKDHYEAELHLGALKRFKDFAPYSLHEFLVTKKANTVSKALAALENEMRKRWRATYPEENEPRYKPSTQTSYPPLTRQLPVHY